MLFPSVRFLVCLFLFFGMCTLYMQRINMSLAILCMVNNTWMQSQRSIEEPFNQTNVFNLKMNDNLTQEKEGICKIQTDVGVMMVFSLTVILSQS
jgi:hypothetical protein